MLSAVCALVIAPAAVDLREYFPIEQGTTWDYIEIVGEGESRYRSEAGKPYDLDGQMVYPIITKQHGRSIGISYYDINSDSIHIIASGYNPSPSPPVPVLMNPEYREKWKYEGLSNATGAIGEMELEGKGKVLKSVKWNGKTYEGIEIRLDATTVEQVSASTGAKTKTEQVSTYAKGIGLIEMKSTTKIGKETYRSTIKLDKFKPVEN